MDDLNAEIERRRALIAQNEARIAKLVSNLWQDQPKAGAADQGGNDEELGLRQQNVILRREIADLKAKLAK